jgi:hypothetical protein
LRGGGEKAGEGGEGKQQGREDAAGHFPSA